MCAPLVRQTTFLEAELTFARHDAIQEAIVGRSGLEHFAAPDRFTLAPARERSRGGLHADVERRQSQRRVGRRAQGTQELRARDPTCSTGEHRCTES
jgi:hypothetical protein